MSLKSIWDRIRSIASNTTDFLVSDESRSKARERVAAREKWEAKRATPRRPRHFYRTPAQVLNRHMTDWSAREKAPRAASTYRAERRNAQRYGKAGGMGSARERGMY